MLCVHWQLASDIIIISKDDARKLLDAITAGNDSDRYKRLRELGLLEAVEDLRRLVRTGEDD